MPHINFHPAPGLGEMLPGWFSIPFNPITGNREVQGYQPSIGELMPGSFVVPENPIAVSLGLCGTGVSGCGCSSKGCMASGGYKVGGLSGLGAISMPFGIDQKWLWIGGGLLLAFLLFRRNDFVAYKTGVRKAKDEYVKAVRTLKGKYPRLGARIGRAAKAAGSSF